MPPCVLYVKCQMSHVTCQITGVMCQVTKSLCCWKKLGINNRLSSINYMPCRCVKASRETQTSFFFCKYIDQIHRKIQHFTFPNWINIVLITESSVPLFLHKIPASSLTHHLAVLWTHCIGTPEKNKKKLYFIFRPNQFKKYFLFVNLRFVQGVFRWPPKILLLFLNLYWFKSP